ncbi:MAG: ester cyclase [Thaumarchaeota archaeon]|nr:ester cyclase [Nitrososphaerota archaeon]
MVVGLEQNKATIRRWYAELDKANLKALDDILSPHIVVHFPGETGPIGRDEYMKINRKFFAGFSDFQTTVLDQIGEGDKVVTRAMHSVVHTGEYEGVRPSGKRLSYSYIAIDRFEDGKVVEHWVEYDEAGLQRQLKST